MQFGTTGFYPWVGKIPSRRERLPTPVFSPEEFHGLYMGSKGSQRVHWGRKQSDKTEQLSHEGMTNDVRDFTRKTRTFKRNTNVQTNVHRP